MLLAIFANNSLFRMNLFKKKVWPSLIGFHLKYKK